MKRPKKIIHTDNYRLQWPVNRGDRIIELRLWIWVERELDQPFVFHSREKVKRDSTDKSEQITTEIRFSGELSS